MAEIRLFGLPGLPEIRPGDDLAPMIVDAALRVTGGLIDGDVVVVTQKVISKSEGRIVDLETITASPFAEELGRQWNKDPRKIEVVLRESRRIVRMDRGIILAETHHGFVCANAGVDESNVAGHGVLALLPVDPDASARRLRSRLAELTGADVAVIISDTFGRPWRAGLTDVAIGVAGMQPIDDWRGRFDQHGYELRVSVVAVADELAGAAELAGGKTAGIPAVVIRGASYPKGDGSARDLVRNAPDDMFR